MKPNNSWNNLSEGEKEQRISQLSENDALFLEEADSDFLTELKKGLIPCIETRVNNLLEKEREGLEEWQKDRQRYMFGEAGWMRDPSPQRLQRILDLLLT